MSALTKILKLAEKHEPGPSPVFGREHTLLAFMTVGSSQTIGRQNLARASGLGEGSMRTVLRKLTGAGYVETNALGCHMTASGKRSYSSISRMISPPVPLHGSKLTVGESQVAILVRSLKNSLASGIEQRDSAIRIGAAGATTYVIKAGKFSIPGGSNDCEKDFPSKSWSILRAELNPRDSEVVIVCGAGDETTAKLGALSAALTLL